MTDIRVPDGISTNEETTYGLLLDIRRSVRYHDYRRSYYLRIQKWILFSNLVLGSAAFGAFFGDDSTKLVLVVAPVVIAITSAVSVAFKISEMATTHAKLCERFIRLEKRMGRLGNPVVDDLEQIQAEFLEIEIDEPSVFLAVNRMCHNQVLRAEGFPNDSEYIQPLGFWHRRLKNIVPFSDLPTRKPLSRKSEA